MQMVLAEVSNMGQLLNLYYAPKHYFKLVVSTDEIHDSVYSYPSTTLLKGIKHAVNLR